MVNLTLTYVNRTERTSKAGNPYTSLSIKANEYGDKFIGGFGSKANENWKVGDTVEVLGVTEKVVGENKYLNFEMPKTDDTIMEVKNEVKHELVGLSLGMGKLNAKLDKVIEHLSGGKRLDRTSDGSEMPTI